MSERSKALQEAIQNEAHARHARFDRTDLNLFHRYVALAQAQALIAIADALETIVEAQSTLAAKASYRPPFPP